MRKELGMASKRSPRQHLALPAGLLVVVLALATAASAQNVWLDASGDPLPFQEDASIMEFLKSAKVTSEKSIGTGINRSVRVTLEKDGVRAHGIFREVDRRERSITLERVHYQLFADSYLFECAAYELAKLIDIPRIPPVVSRTIRGRKGSLQIWLEDALDEEGDSFAPPSGLAWAEQLWDMYFFDNLVYNIDRNAGNILVSPDYTLWMIDHTRAFQFKYSLLNDRVVRVRRTSWEKLVSLTEDDIRGALGGYLTPAEVGSILKRREQLKEHVAQLVADRGEGAVFY